MSLQTIVRQARADLAAAGIPAAEAAMDADLLARHALGWDLATLLRETGCGNQCGLCRPYLAAMLQTGVTRFTAPVPSVPDIFDLDD